MITIRAYNFKYLNPNALSSTLAIDILLTSIAPLQQANASSHLYVPELLRQVQESNNAIVWIGRKWDIKRLSTQPLLTSWLPKHLIATRDSPVAALCMVDDSLQACPCTWGPHNSYSIWVPYTYNRRSYAGSKSACPYAYKRPVVKKQDGHWRSVTHVRCHEKQRQEGNAFNLTW